MKANYKYLTNIDLSSNSLYNVSEIVGNNYDEISDNLIIRTEGTKQGDIIIRTEVEDEGKGKIHLYTNSSESLENLGISLEKNLIGLNNKYINIVSPENDGYINLSIPEENITASSSGSSINILKNSITYISKSHIFKDTTFDLDGSNISIDSSNTLALNAPNTDILGTSNLTLGSNSSDNRIEFTDSNKKLDIRTDIYNSLSDTSTTIQTSNEKFIQTTSSTSIDSNQLNIEANKSELKTDDFDLLVPVTNPTSTVSIDTNGIDIDSNKIDIDSKGEFDLHSDGNLTIETGIDGQYNLVSKGQTFTTSESNNNYIKILENDIASIEDPYKYNIEIISELGTLLRSDIINIDASELIINTDGNLDLYSPKAHIRALDHLHLLIGDIPGADNNKSQGIILTGSNNSLSQIDINSPITNMDSSSSINLSIGSNKPSINLTQSSLNIDLDNDSYLRFASGSITFNDNTEIDVNAPTINISGSSIIDIRSGESFIEWRPSSINIKTEDTNLFTDNFTITVPLSGSPISTIVEISESGVKADTSGSITLSSTNSFIQLDINEEVKLITKADNTTLSNSTIDIIAPNTSIEADTLFKLSTKNIGEEKAFEVSVPASPSVSDPVLLTTHNLKVNRVANFDNFAIYWDDDTNSIVFTEGNVAWQ